MRCGRADRADLALEALKAAGAQLEPVSIESGEIQGFNHFDAADRFKVSRTVEGAKASMPLGC